MTEQERIEKLEKRVEELEKELKKINNAFFDTTNSLVEVMSAILTLTAAKNPKEREKIHTALLRFADASKERPMQSTILTKIANNFVVTHFNTPLNSSGDK